MINLLVLSSFIWPGQEYKSFQMGLLISVRLISDALSGLVWGWASDRFSRKWLFITGCLISSLAVIGNGFAPVGHGDADFQIWFLLRILMGVGIGCFGPVTNSLVTDLFEKYERARYFGKGTLVYSFCQIVGLIVSSNIFILGYWRLFYFVSGSLFIVLAIYLLIYFKEPMRGAMEHEIAKVLSATGSRYNYKITKETVKSVLFSSSNILVLVEGIFTSLFFGIVDLVLIPYIQGPPTNISPSVFSYIILIFSIPATLIGSVLLAKFSDKLAEKSSRNRIYLIIIGLIIGAIFSALVFTIQIPSLTLEQGNSFKDVFVIGKIQIIGVVLLVSRVSFSIFNVNQTPIIQELNLPETQGTMKSLNQLVETVGYALGPIFAAFLLEIFNQNYSALSPAIFLFSLPGIIMWFIVLSRFNHDRSKISQILAFRSEEIQQNFQNQ